jgi:hypothetical protein
MSIAFPDIPDMQSHETFAHEKARCEAGLSSCLDFVASA